MSDRGMKKWAPYASLIEQATFVNKMLYEKGKKSKPTQTNDLIEKINFILETYHSQLLKITFYYDGYSYTINKVIKKIDIQNKTLIFDNGKLTFDMIEDIEDLTGF